MPAPGLRGCLLGWHELDHRNEQYGDGDDVRNSSSTTTWTAVELFRKSITAYGPAADADVTPADVVAAYHQARDLRGRGLPAGAQLLLDVRHAGRDVHVGRARRFG